MAVNLGHEQVTSHEQWYERYEVDARDDTLIPYAVGKCGDEVWREFQQYKNEMDARVSNYGVLEKMADAEVISPKPDLPNISSGETAGIVRRTARNLVQNTPNVEVISRFNDDDVRGIFSRHILTSKIIGSDAYSNDMQQNLFASTKTSLTVGFACAIPVLMLDASKGWYIKYDTIHYRDVFPEPGCKDVRDATTVYVRRYLTKGEVVQLIRQPQPGWDVHALKTMLKSNPPNREQQSDSHQNKKHRGQTPTGYEIITRYTNDGDNFVTFTGSGANKMLLRIEKNKHPLGKHPVYFLVLERDDMQPLGKSQVELLVGRQDFQDLMLNGAMKLWYRNINPSIIGYGTVNSVPNLSPGKYTQISNPNAKVEAFEVNTQTLLQYGQISQQNLASMVSMVGTADMQMAQSGGNASGMSATPQGVEAQQTMVDVTTNNYQKAIESFFSHYCSHALTLFFAELRGVKTVKLTADARMKLLEAGLPADKINDDDTLDIDFEDMQAEYWVRCVPGSLVEMEDEKQLRILNELFVPLSQAMPALAASQEPQMIKQAAQAMSWIIGKQIELSGAAAAKDIGLIWTEGDVEQVREKDARFTEIENRISGVDVQQSAHLELQAAAIQQLQEQMSLMAQNQQALMQGLGVFNEQPTDQSPTGNPEAPVEGDSAVPAA